MKKSVIVKRIILVVLFAAVLLLTPVLFFIKTPLEQNMSKWTSTIEIKDRVAYPASNSIDFKVDKAGEHTVYFSLIPEGYDKDSLANVKLSNLGFITTLVITDSSDNVVYSSSQSAAFLDTVIYLEPGNYKVTYYYFTDENEFYDFSSEFLCSSKEAARLAKDVNFPSFIENGTAVFNYEFCCLSKEKDLFFPSLMLGWGIVFGLLLAMLLTEFFFFGKDGTKKYDERQILEQGKAFKIGFFTLLIIVESLIILNLTGIATIADYPIFYQLAVFIGLGVYVSYCIWHESYFAINEKSTRVLILFAFIAVFNLVISIVNFVNGWMIVDGRITFRVLNIFCTLLFLIIFAVLLLKRIANSRSASSDDDDDEEDD
ncbi:MAG: hypothetical protein K5776_13100 [Lachnospiraceae bacterium]|nr:hypothetical protein [Lachnospiraceae bacterium]